MTGSSGFVGTALRRALAERGWTVTRVVRPASARSDASAVQWDPVSGTIDTAALEGHDVVLHLAGETLQGLWTQAKKRRIVDSRLRGTELIATAIAGLTRKPRLLVSWSGSDYYGDRDPSIPLTEDAPPGDSFLARVCVKWEAAARPAAESGIRLVTMRSGIVLDSTGGVLPVMLPAFRMGLGAPFGNGKQPWPWISLDDMVGATLHAIDNDSVAGPINAVAPGRVSNEEFTRALARAVGRPVLLRIPAWAARLAPGGMADELLLSGAPLVPQKLLDTHYAFRWPDLEPALAHMLAR